MATIKPFAALRPEPGLAPRICELPYDVMSSEEARQVAAGNPLSFLHVSKPEIDLPPATDVYAPEVYAKGRENFQRLIAQGALRQDPQPCFYLYRQIMGAHSQTGLVAAASCEEYLKGIIRKHELTRPDKEDDRVRHIEALDSQTGPVFLVYGANRAMDEFVARKTAEPPNIDFTASDGVRHTAWVIADAAGIRFIEAEFSRIPRLYIADGHHRSAAAARVFQKRKGAGESASFLSVIFPHNQMQILPYNRVLKDLNGLSPAQLLEKLAGVFVITPPRRRHPDAQARAGPLPRRPVAHAAFSPALHGGDRCHGDARRHARCKSTCSSRSSASPTRAPASASTSSAASAARRSWRSWSTAANTPAPSRCSRPASKT